MNFNNFNLKLDSFIIELENINDGLDQILLLSQEIPTLSKNIDKFIKNKN